MNYPYWILVIAVVLFLALGIRTIRVHRRQTREHHAMRQHVRRYEVEG